MIGSTMSALITKINYVMKGALIIMQNLMSLLFTQ